MGAYKDKNRRIWFASARYKKSGRNFLLPLKNKKSRGNSIKIYLAKQFDKNECFL